MCGGPPGCRSETHVGQAISGRQMETLTPCDDMVDRMGLTSASSFTTTSQPLPVDNTYS